MLFRRVLICSSILIWVTDPVFSAHSKTNSILIDQLELAASTAVVSVGMLSGVGAYFYLMESLFRFNQNQYAISSGFGVLGTALAGWSSEEIIEKYDLQNVEININQ